MIVLISPEFMEQNHISHKRTNHTWFLVTKLLLDILQSPEQYAWMTHFLISISNTDSWTVWGLTGIHYKGRKLWKTVPTEKYPNNNETELNLLSMFGSNLFSLYSETCEHWSVLPHTHMKLNFKRIVKNKEC